MNNGAAKTIYFDACCFLAYFSNEVDRAECIDTLFEESIQDKINIVTSVITLTEVAAIKKEFKTKKLEDGFTQKLDKVFYNRKLLDLVECSPFTAMRARKIIRESIPLALPNIKPADAIHIASALEVRADMLFTYDGKLHKHSKHFGIPIRDPYTQQVRLIPKTASSYGTS
jgi:predicted nucleic acid-binding protein